MSIELQLQLVALLAGICVAAYSIADAGKAFVCRKLGHRWRRQDRLDVARCARCGETLIDILDEATRRRTP